MKRCVYLIPHAGNFSKKDGKSMIGSSTHIGIGIKQLEKYFEVHPVVISFNNNIKKVSKSSPRSSSLSIKRNRLTGVLRDIKALIKNNIGTLSVYMHIRKIKPDFIYERSEYLSFSGIVIARLLGIPHYYESNWVHYEGIRQFYLSYFNPIAKRLEELMYSRSTQIFFVGNQHLLLNLKKSNWTTIQNGVEERIINQYVEHENTINSDVINICVLASLMKHHRLDIFIQSLRQLKDTSKIRIYFIGVNFDSSLSHIPQGIKYEYLGAMPKEKLYDILATMNIAVISGGPFYSSFMKLYDYAAVKLAIVCPDLTNLTGVFSDDEILFFNDKDSHDLAKKIEFLIQNPEEIKNYGINIYNRVASEFTWETIFFNISTFIKSKVDK